MRMDNNKSPEWVAQCKASSSGRKALRRIAELESNLRAAHREIESLGGYDRSAALEVSDD